MISIAIHYDLNTSKKKTWFNMEKGGQTINHQCKNMLGMIPIAALHF